MLKAFRELALTGPRLPEPEVVRAGMAAAGRFLGLAGVAFLLGRAVLAAVGPMCALAPFAIALFAAGLTAGLNPAPLLAGCVLGAVGPGLRAFNLALPLGCAVVLAGSLIRSAVGPRLGRLWGPKLRARSPNPEAAAGMVLAGLGVLLPGLFYAGGALWPSAQATAAAVAAVAAEPFLWEALRWSASRRRGRGAMAGARVGLCLLGLMGEAGLCAVCPPVALGVGGLLAALLWPVGALAGLALGGATLLTGGDGRYVAALGLCGALAQAGPRAPECMRTVAVALGALAGAFYMKLPVPALAGLGAGTLLTLAVPEAWREAAARWAQRPEPGCDPDRLAALLRADSLKRLDALSAAFGELAEGYLIPASLPDEQALINRLRAALCEGCPGYGDCWTGEANRGARLLCTLVTHAAEWEGGPGLFEEGVPVELTRRCRRGRLIPDRIGELLEDFARGRRSELKRCGENRLISAQFLQARQLIDALAAAQAKPPRLRDGRARRALAALAGADIPVSDALTLAGSELAVTLREGVWTEALAHRAADRLTRALGGLYAPSGSWGRTLRLTRQPKLVAAVGAGSAALLPGEASGDSHVTAMLDDERLLVLICDGMGSGDAAGRESARAARLLGRFLAAGADWGLAVETVNAMLVNVSAEDMFSTVDLMILNLSTGMAECVKLAACPTLVARGGVVERIEGGRLPLGILERVQPAASRARLMPGDVLLMASDGVMDAADPEALEALLTGPADDMNALSEQVIALAQQGGAHRDDMTAVCVRVEERRAG